MTSNDLLLSHLAALSDDEAILRAMSACVFGLVGEMGPQGFGATTLEGRLVLFTHPEFRGVAGLPEGLDAVEATARQAAEYARTISVGGFALNPGTHQRRVGGDAVDRLHHPLKAPAPPAVPPLVPWADAPKGIVEAVRAAAENALVEAAWLAVGEIVVTRPHPDPAFEAGLLARDVRLRSYAAVPEWAPVFEQEAPARARVRLAALPHRLPDALVADLRTHARIHRLKELWAFGASVAGAETALALAYSPHPHDRFAEDFQALHARHHLGEAAVPLLSADELRDALPRIGTRLV